MRNYSLCTATQSLWVARCPVWVGHSCPTPLTLTLPLTGKARLHRPGKNSPLPPCHAERSRIVQRTILRSRSIPTAITKPDKNIHLKTTSSTLLRNAMSNRYGGTRPIPAAKRRHRKARARQCREAESGIDRVRFSGRHEFSRTLNRPRRCRAQAFDLAANTFAGYSAPGTGYFENRVDHSGGWPTLAAR